MLRTLTVTALVLLQHTDVVPADPKYWTTEPLSGELRDMFAIISEVVYE